MFGLKELERKERKGIGGISNLLFGWLNERERKGNESLYFKHFGFHPNLGGNGGKGKESNSTINNFFKIPKITLYIVCIHIVKTRIFS